MGYLKTLDQNLLKWAYTRPFHNNLLVKGLIFAGDGPFWMLLVLIAALVGQLLPTSLGQTAQQLSILLMLGLTLGNFVFVPFKKKVNRRRPYANPELQQRLKIQIINRDPGHGSKAYESFPSGHVLWTTLCISLMVYSLGLPALLVFGWMIPAMMFLRPYLGVHYPSDVAVGLLLAMVVTGISMLIAEDLFLLVESLEGYSAFTVGYWVIISVFLIAGFKSWAKRV